LTSENNTSPAVINPLTIKALTEKEDAILEAWMENRVNSSDFRETLISGEELRSDSQSFLRAFITAIANSNVEEMRGKEFNAIRRLLLEISEARAAQAFSPSETAFYVFSLKESLLPFLRDEYRDDPETLLEELNKLSKALDKLGSFIFVTTIKNRERVIRQQQQDMLELSTPVVQIWDRIICLPLIGALDSRRTQLMMERLLERIVRTRAEVAILDITGVPTVDTQVANYLIKTVTAVRLLGSTCIITGVGPSIAQTIVHLGIDLSGIITRNQLSDGIRQAFEMTRQRVVPINAADGEPSAEKGDTDDRPQSSYSESW
ncbi:MAG TPA: STAS domain-containing protein, partial [Blastocatellia bacterium]|nr:STAS domain-containing protein [Blastocatellia bacterium]